MSRTEPESAFFDRTAHIFDLIDLCQPTLTSHGTSRQVIHDPGYFMDKCASSRIVS